MALLAGPEQRKVLDQVGGLMSLLEGHGDVTMDRAGADQIPSAARFGQVLRQRRQQGNPLAKFAAEAHRPRRQDEAVRAGRALHRSGREPKVAPNCSTGRGRNRRTCRRWPRSVTPTRGWRASGRHTRSRPDRSRSPSRCADLLPRCTFPDPGPEPVTLAVSGGPDSLALLVLAAAAGLASSATAVHVDHGLRPGSAAEAEVVAAAAARVRARVPVRDASSWVPGRTWRPGRARPATAVLPPMCSRATPPTTEPRRSCSTCCGAPGSTGLSALRPSRRRPLLGLRRTETEQLCARCGLEPVRDPSNSRPALPSQPGAVRGAAPAGRRGRTGSRARPLSARPTCWLTTPTCSPRWAAPIDPTDAKALVAAPRPVARRRRPGLAASRGRRRPAPGRRRGRPGAGRRRRGGRRHRGGRRAAGVPDGRSPADGVAVEA